MSILNRYIFREVAIASLVGTLLFTLVLFLQRVEPVMELLVGRGAPGSDMLHLIALTIPQSFPFTIPMGVLTGILVGLGRLSSDNEVLAIQAAGIKWRSLMKPVALVALLGLATCAATTLLLTPWSLREQVRITESFRIKLAGTEVVPRVFIEDFPDHVIWVQDVLPGVGVHWRGIFMADMRNPENRGSVSGFNASVDGPRITFASEAFVLPRPEQNRIQVRFPLTTTYEQSSDSSHYLAVRSESTDQVLQARTSRFDSRARQFDRMDTLTLIKAVSTETAPQANILLQQRFALPFACLFLPLAGLPLAISRRRSGRASGIILSLLLCFVYWMILLTGTAVAEQIALSAIPAVWAANIFFGVLGILLLRQMNKPSRRDWQLLISRRLTSLWNRVSRIYLRRKLSQKKSVAAPSTQQHPVEPLLPLIDRYLLRSFLFYLLVLVMAFIVLMFVFSFFELLNDMLARDKLSQFIPYLYYLTPFLVYNTAPLAMMMATLICFLLLARRHELIAFLSCGISLYRLATPVLILAALIGGGLFALEEGYLPEANRRQDALRDEIKGRPPRTYLRPDRQWTFGQQDRIFYHRHFNQSTNVFSGINIYDLNTSPFELRRHIQAERASWDVSEGTWVFHNGWVRQLDGIETVRYESFTERSFPSITEQPDYFLKEDRHDQQLNLNQLKAYILDLTQSGFDTVRLKIQMHKKIVFPVFAFSMALLAVPFAMLSGHRSTMVPICFSLVMVIVYYASNALAEQLGRAGHLQPPLAAWAPCLLFAFGGLYLMLRVRT